jgi:2-polyprenyl-3-methyl-5-hydroxy-6-metoxy-1,4-benzoquinol methylase
MDSWPAGGVEPVPSCPVCDASRRHPLHAGLTDRNFFRAPGEWDLYSCDECGCSYLDPRPTPETIELAYRGYYTHASPTEAGAGSPGLMRRVRDALANGYLNWRLGTKLQPASKLGVIVAGLLPGQRGRLDRGLRDLHSLERGARVLDVGSGAGEFLQLAQAAGYGVAGVDPDAVAVEAARERGFDVRVGGIEAFADMPASFDLITMGHVIEHVHDPRAVLRQAALLLRPGGRVWIDTPNIDSYGHRRYGRHWLDLDPPRHLVLFNWGALESLLAQEGLQTTRRFRSAGAYPFRSAASRAIGSGLDPFKYGSVRASDVAAGVLRGVGTRFDYRRSEFVMLTAVKA